MRHSILQLAILASLFLLTSFVLLYWGLWAPIGCILRTRLGLRLTIVDMHDDRLGIRGRRRVQIGKCWWDGVDEFLDIV